MSAGDNWHPVGVSHSIEAGSSAGIRLFGQELVVWRDTSGVAHVWEDRCPHRGMKLSFGFVRGDHIACLYHGWQYDRAGYCQYIPAHPDVLVVLSAQDTCWPAQEQGGMIWPTLSENPPPYPGASSLVVSLRRAQHVCSAGAAIAGLGM